MNYCPECGSPIRGGVKYCTTCGYSLIEVKQTEGANHPNETALKKKRHNILWFVLIVICVGCIWVADAIEEEMAHVSKMNQAVTESIIRRNAAEMMTELLAENFTNAPRCKGILITERLGNEQYRGVAYLDNGNELPIYFHLQGEELYVKILPQR